MASASVVMGSLLWVPSAVMKMSAACLHVDLMPSVRMSLEATSAPATLALLALLLKQNVKVMILRNAEANDRMEIEKIYMNVWYLGKG